MEPTGRSAAIAFTIVLAASTGALAQTPYQDDMACRQYADAQVAPLRAQIGAQGFGSTLLGAGVGAAIGGAIGGGRGAGIGAASGAILGTGAGMANAQNAEAYLAQQYNAYYGHCMSARRAAYAPPPGYSSAPSYPPQPGYGPSPGGATARDLNHDELNQLRGQPRYPQSGY